MDSERAKRGLGQGEPRDVHDAEVDFNALRDAIFELIIEDDPREASKLGISSRPITQADIDRVERIKQEEETELQA